MLPALLLSLALPLQAASLPGIAISSGTAGELSRVEASLSASLTGRRLLAETAEVPRRELPSAAGRSGMRYAAALGVLAFDSSKLRELSEWSAELVLSRELARASQHLPIELIESETAASQVALEVAVERAMDDKAFDARLRASRKRMQKVVESLRASQAWQRSRVPLDVRDVPVLALPSDEFDRAAYFLDLFLNDPEEFYWAVERGQAWPPEAVGLTELEDFLEKHAGVDLAKPPVGPSGLYVTLSGRRYRPALVAAAQAVRQAGGRPLLREALGGFDSVAMAPLRAKLNAWSRK